jgi:UDP-N-acetylglucosamine acyltransferase
VAQKIHPTALVDPGAQLGQGVEVGPFTIIEDKVVIGEGTWIDSHVTIRSHTVIGRNNKIFSYASIGAEPQDLTYNDEPTQLIIGDGNLIREFVTFHRGSVKGGGVTTIGNEGMFMAYVHIAHDCRIGDHVVMANTATLSGHVIVEDWASMSGFSAVHQFARLGAHSFVGAMCGVGKDVPPFCMVAGNRASLKGLNAVGLRRRGFSPETLAGIKQAYRILFRNSGSTLTENTKAVEGELGHLKEVRHLIDFLRSSERGICR